jgi:histidyl-tRNA synthetase
MDEQKTEGKQALQALRGMKDVLPAEARYYQMLESAAQQLFQLYGYGEIRTPVLETTELFARSVGEASDIVVSKQMYCFVDPGERANTMRPEGTAGVVRALIEAGLFKETSQQKVYYQGPMFRYEKPQKGRLRQFNQIGVEFFGVAHPAADAEVIAMSLRLMKQLGFKDPSVKINNIGCRECRQAYNERLREAIRELSGDGSNEWCEQCLQRAELNPMRVFDCKVENCRALVEKLPRVSEFVCQACRDHYDSVLNLLEIGQVAIEQDPELVRGLDYYSQTVFEVVQGGLGSQNAVLGGGRYDYLVEELGGPPTPAVGFAIGVERLIMAMQSQHLAALSVPEVEYYILALEEQSVPEAVRLADLARSSGVHVSFDCQPRSARAGMKAANRSGARVALLIGSDELAKNVAQWKNLESGEQVELDIAEVERNITNTI